MLKIRPFVQGSDEEIYVRIFNVAFGDYEDIRDMTLDEMLRMEESPTFNADGLFIAEWNGKTAGMVDAYVDKLRNDQKGFIQSLSVLPEFRRKGIARKLVEKAAKSLRQRRMKVADTWAQSDREGCVSLFESLRFKLIRVTSLMKRSLANVTIDGGVNEQILIRKAQLRDENEIFLLNKLDNEAFKEHFNYRPRTIDETKYSLLETPWWKEQEAWFAILNKEPVGYVVGGIDADLNKMKNVRYGWILDIGVLKPFRRRGIGSSLLRYSLNWLKSREMDDALLYVDDMNPTEAIKLYEEVGFEVSKKNFIYQLALT